jgi:uncharacterized protein YyaL (SSP411 family)
MHKLFYPIIFLLLSSCNAQQKPMDTKQHTYTNHLIHETSPYLLQHAHNPVNWYPWGKAAFEKARKENKLVLVSIGYAACHWCHVMEKESFENEGIAKIMNDNFVCIKVDREQRPDVDHQYMDAVQLLTGRGGWPLNCFALPDGRPVWGGTYFPPKQWMSVLTQLSELWKTEPEKLKQQAEQITNGIHRNHLLRLSDGKQVFRKSDVDKALSLWHQHFDMKWGGNTGAPKFPMPSNYRFLLNEYYHNEDKSLLKYVTLSLDKMAQGGIYAHLGGGFARYATDSHWKVPHFEKMLYDNGQLLQLYSEAYRMTHKPLYKNVVYQTVEFLRRELLAPEGGFYASLDADSDGGEGNYYVWTKNEIDRVLGKEAPFFNAYYSVTASGNWENGKNVLFVQQDLEKTAAAFNLSLTEAKASLAASRKKLFAIRDKRTRPGTDTKILTSWNALVISGLLSAYGAFDNPEFLKMAEKTANFIKTQRMETDGKLWRARRNEKKKVPGFLDDYAFTAQAFLNLYRYTFDEQWLQSARQIIHYALLHFYDKPSGMFLYSAAEEGADIQPKTEITDNVIPSSNSAMASVLARAGIYFEDNSYSETARNMIAKVYPSLLKNLPYFSNWGLLLNHYLYPAQEVVFAGKNALKLSREFEQHYTTALVAGSLGKSETPLLKDRFIPGKTLIYVCEDKTCKLPVKTIKEVLLLLRK